LAEIVAGWGIVGRLSDRELVRQLIPELFVRAGQRLRRPSQLLASLWPRKGAVINTVRRFKGL
jgi:hypothetical protein